MAGRELVVGYDSALDFWRSARVAEVGRADDSSVVYGARRLELGDQVQLALSFCRSDPPLEVAVSRQDARHNCSLIQSRVWKGPLGPDLLFSLGDGISVCRMPAVLVQLAGHADEVELAEVAYEMVGTYGLAPDVATGSMQDLAPLVDLGELRSYARSTRALGVRGAARAFSALELVAPNSNSPRKTQIGIALMMSRARGGFSLRGFVMNPKIDLPRSLWRVADQPSIRPDFYWPDLGMIVEYDSDEHHLSPAARTRDEKRRRAFKAEGYDLHVLTNDVLRSNAKLNAFLGELVKRADPRRAPASESMLAKRRALRERLFGAESAGEAIREISDPLLGKVV